MKYIKIKTDLFKSYDKLSEKEKASLMDMIINVAQGQDIREIKTVPIVQVISQPIIEDMIYNNLKYESRVKKNKKSANKRWKIKDIDRVIL